MPAQVASKTLDNPETLSLDHLTLASAPPASPTAVGLTSERQTPAETGSLGKPIVWVGLGVSLVCLYFFLRNVEWPELWASLTQARYVYIVPALGFWFLMLYIRALRWQVMVRHLRPVGIGSLMSSTLIGFMASGLLPARAGEIVRAAVLARKEKLGVSSVFATIVVERIFDLLAVLFFLVLVLIYLPVAGQHAALMGNLRFFGGLFAAVIAGAIVFLTLLRLWPHRVKRFFSPLLSRLPPRFAHQVEAILDNFIEGLGMLTGLRDLVSISALSLVLWLVIGLINWALSFAFDIQMSVLGGCLIFVFTAFAIALPQAPSFIGVFHVAVEKSLLLLSVSTISAKSYAIVLWTISLFPPIVLGLAILWHEGFSLGELTRIRQNGTESRR
ncbi:MAG: flippase-like domain-containing protein [Candidatus Riflebacteria bacterium]|nr:flippase-like domain-containing protein [Candidatus Riflebacteria bacterium]